MNILKVLELHIDIQTTCSVNTLLADRQLPKFPSDKYLKKQFLYVGPKFSYLGIFGWNSKKLLHCGFFYISTLKFLQTKLLPTIKILKFGIKIALIGYFGLEFQKMSNLKSVSSTSNLLTCKFSSKNKTKKI